MSGMSNLRNTIKFVANRRGDYIVEAEMSLGQIGDKLRLRGQNLDILAEVDSVLDSIDRGNTDHLLEDLEDIEERLRINGVSV